MADVGCDSSDCESFEQREPFAVRQRVDARPERVVAAETISRLSRRCSHLTEAFYDDMLGLIRREGYKPEQYGRVYRAVRSHNPASLPLVVVYTHELEPSNWDGLLPFTGVVNLWVWRASHLRHLDDSLERAQRLFPVRPINIGRYRRDYPTASPVPMDWLRLRWESVRCYLDQVLITPATPSWARC